MGRVSIVSVGSTYHQYHIPQENNGSKTWKGPRKVVSFCLLAVVLPCVLVSVALLMRFVVHGSAIYHLAPSDMRILDHRISTIWCQSEVVRGNTSFTAYLTDGEPEMVKSPEPVIVERNIIVPDDHKEFWGFYLLQGSTFKVYTCARFKGGTLLIVRGRNHLEHCAYIGESDSAGNSDEFSSSNSRENAPNADSALGPTSKEEMGQILSKIRHYIRSRPKNFNQLKQNLADWMLIDKSGEKQGTSPSTVLPSSLSSNVDNKNETVVEPYTNLTSVIIHSKENQIIEHGSLFRRRRQVEVRKDTESGENGAFEEIDPLEESKTPKETKTGHSIWSQEHEDQHGILNDTADPNDGSNSESESSWSSSEEAMSKCEGVLGNFVLKANSTCGLDNEGGEYWDIEPFYEGVVNVSGYYYFIFGSENEKRDNIIRAKFHLEKYIYHLPQPIANCTNVKECQVNFTFSSNEKLVITVPQPITNPAAWNEIYVAESDCKPRTILYLIFVILVPLVILLCAFQ